MENKYKCPICGKTTAEVHSFMRCPKMLGEVCMTHCFKDCSSFDYGKSSLFQCKFGHELLPDEFANQLEEEYGKGKSPHI